MTLPVRSPNAELKDGRFPIVALVGHGANMHDWALQAKGQPMKIHPATKAAACKALGGLAERSVAMADAINKGEDDANAPGTLPEEMALSVTSMGADFAKAMEAFMPKAAPQQQAPADPEVEMTAEMVAASEAQAAQQTKALDAIEKVMKARLTTKSVALVAKGLDAVADLRKAMSETPIAKSGAKKLTFSQYMKTHGSLFESFMALVMQFLPLLVSGDGAAAPAEGEPPPADDMTSSPGAVDMQKAIADATEKATAKAVDVAVAKAMEQVEAKIGERIAPMADQLTLIAKGREGSNTLPPEARPSPGTDKNGEMIPFQSLTDSMRARGLLKAS